MGDLWNMLSGSSQANFPQFQFTLSPQTNRPDFVNLFSKSSCLCSFTALSDMQQSKMMN